MSTSKVQISSTEEQVPEKEVLVSAFDKNKFMI